MYLAFIEHRGEEVFASSGEALFAFLKFLASEFDPQVTAVFFGNQMRWGN